MDAARPAAAGCSAVAAVESLDRRVPDVASTRIPHVIHQMWSDRSPPALLANLSATWSEHHPSWTHRLWTDAAIDHFLRTEFPNLSWIRSATVAGR